MHQQTSSALEEQRALFLFFFSSLMTPTNLQHLVAFPWIQSQVLMLMKWQIEMKRGLGDLNWSKEGEAKEGGAAYRVTLTKSYSGSWMKEGIIIKLVAMLSFANKHFVLQLYVFYF